MALNSASVQSVICCPSGSDCAFIQTITCDVNQLNATLHPDNQMHLSETDGVDLPKCGDKCCPLGYTCKSGMCSKDSSTSPSSSPTSTTGPTSSATNPASASQTSNCPVAASVQASQGFDGRSFAAGFFPGIVLGALSTIGLIWVIKKRRESQSKERYSGDFGHVARQISDPIYDPVHAARTDFIRRGSQSAQPSPNSTDKIITGMKGTGTAAGGLTPRIKSMWDRTPKLNFGFATGLPSNPAPPPPAIRAGNSNVDPYTTPRQTPRRKHSKHSSRSQSSSHRHAPTRSGSQETIDVLMPAPSFLEPPKAPGMRENRLTTDSSNTTFTKLMERAGFDETGQQEVRDWRTPRR
ncbi:Nn.00g099660.m01.CDS01 [Neocucurbitaria sp. VM-36]